MPEERHWPDSAKVGQQRGQEVSKYDTGQQRSCETSTVDAECQGSGQKLSDEHPTVHAAV